MPRVALIRISVAARTGDLPAQFDKIAAYYAREANTRVTRLRESLQPLVLLFLSTMLAVLAFGALVPILHLSQPVRG